MEERTLPKLRTNKEDARKQLGAQIETGQELYNREISSEDELSDAYDEFENWSKFNGTLLLHLFDTPSVANDYEEFSHRPYMTTSSTPFTAEVEYFRSGTERLIKRLNGISREIELYEESFNTHVKSPGDKVFVGHGHSQCWRDLQNFIVNRLKLPCDEFNRIPTAGMTIPERLEQMLDQACMAFLVMTGEDEQADGKLHARMNVIHEAGLFQGRLGLKKAIILLEDGCEKFSNIHGVVEIRFPKGEIRAAFEEIREVMEREGVLG